MPTILAGLPPTIEPDGITMLFGTMVPGRILEPSLTRTKDPIVTLPPMWTWFEMLIAEMVHEGPMKTWSPIFMG